MKPKKMKNIDRLCIHTITTKPWSIEEIIENYHNAGIKAISVWREVLQNRDPVIIGEKIRKAGIKIVSLVRGGFFPAQTRIERESAIKNNKLAIDEAAALKTPMVILVCGAVSGQSIRNSLDQIEAGLEKILPYAEKNGIKLAIEPLHPMYADNRSVISTMEIANNFAEKFDSPFLGVAVDVFHVWWDPGLEREIRRCGQHGNLLAFHICDWKSDMEDRIYDRGLMGEGIIRIREIRSWMEESGFNGFNEVEIFSNRWWQTDQKLFLEKIKETYLKCS